jgi:hypothetical protein
MAARNVVANPVDDGVVPASPLGEDPETAFVRLFLPPTLEKGKERVDLTAESKK